jgi:predicted MFS family arabinose efflux permease
MSAAAFVARLPISMLGLGIVLLVSLQTGSYALAGALSATDALANALIGPPLARLVDRHGQRRVVPWLTLVHVSALVIFTLLVLEGGPTLLQFGFVALAGAAMPNFGALVRARWAGLLAGEAARLRTAFAYESVVDEIIFVAGPPVATLLAVTYADWSAVALCVVLVVIGTVLFLRLRATEPPPSPAEDDAGPSALRYPGVLAVTVVFVLLGAMFGSFEIVTVAFADEHGTEGAAGLLLGLYALGSGIAGVALGAADRQPALHRQLYAAAGVLAVVMLPFAAIHSLWLLGLACLVSGLAVSPVLISGFALVERLVPNTRLTEGLVWVNTGLMLGISLAAAFSGAVIDARGASVAYLICTACALGTLAAITIAYRTLDRAWAGAVRTD